jgi:hypothetical protein
VTALVLTTALPGGPTRRRTVLSTATPGLYLARHRHPCPHDAEVYEPGVCPGCQPWEWDVVAACGLVVARPPWEDGLTLRGAAALAADLGGTGVDWTTLDVVDLLDQLTPALAVVTTVLRDHGVWVPGDPVAPVAATRARYAAPLAGPGRP